MNNEKNVCTFFSLLTLQLCSISIDPAHYCKHSQVQWTWAVLSLDSIELKGSEHLLDIGSGDGKISSLLSSRLPSGFVTGIDPSEEFVALSQALHQQHNLDFQVGDVQCLPYSEEFDLITAFLSLNWVPDIELALKEMFRAAKPGATALIVIPNRPDPELVKEWRSRFSDEKWLPYLHLFTKQFNRSEEEWKSAIQESGWTLEKWEVVKTATVFHDRQEMKNWILSINVGLNQLPPDLLEELIDIRLEMISSVYPQAGDGRIYAFPEKLTLLLRKTSPY